LLEEPQLWRLEEITRAGMARPRVPLAPPPNIIPLRFITGN
jgi:hypothetical protein